MNLPMQKPQKIGIRKGRVLPWTMRFLGTVIIALSIIQTLSKLPEFFAIPIAIISSLLLPSLWFSFNIITIDNVAKELYEGIWVMGYRLGKVITFKQIEKVYINKVTYTQSMHSLANHTHTIKNVAFKAFIKLDNGKKYFLFSSPTEEHALQKVKEVETKLGLV